MSTGAPADVDRRLRFALFVEGALTVRPATDAVFERFVADFSRVERPLLDRAGVEIAAAFRLEGTPSHRLLHLYRFASLADMEARGRAMGRDPAIAELADLYSWVDDPEFAYTRVMGGSLPFLDLSRLDAFASQDERPWLVLRQRLRFATPPKAMPSLQAQFDCWRQAGAFDLVLGYDTIHGSHGDVVGFGLPAPGMTLEALQASRPADVTARLRPFLVTESVEQLTPMPYSSLR